MSKGSKILKGTTSQQKLFAYAYFNNKGNGTQAAIEAGYSKKSAKEQASRLLTYANVQNLLTHLGEKLETKAIITKERVLQEYARIGLFDARTLYNEDGSLKNIHDMDDVAAAVINGIEVDEIFEMEGKQKKKVGETVKVKLNGKIAALDSIRDTMGWRAPVKTANTDKEGNDISPMTDEQVDKLINVLRETKNT